ncbi:MAG: colanic acid biosynthesis glycosyltransferase WcaL, partial [Caldilineae bacterium]
LYFLLTRPRRYLSTFFLLLTHPGESLHNRLRTFMHFGGAVFLAMQIRRQNIRHIHAHFSVNAATMALVIARLLGISFSFTAHNNFFTDKIVLKEKLRAAKFILAISEYNREYLLKLLPEEGLRDKFHIVHCGVSPADFCPPAEKPVNNPPLIFSVSHLTERKGFPVLVEACRLLSERGVPFACLIGGDGAQRPLLEEMIARYGLQEQVKLLGVIFQEDLRQYLCRADIFALPCQVAQNGDMDGIPVALMEAMAMELPVVSTRISGIPELVTDGHDGLLVEQKDPVALADALQRLLTDPALRHRLGKRARQKIVQSFDVDKSAARLAQIFHRYLNEGVRHG